MIWLVAWRNVWRNKLRSLVVILAVVMGMFGGTFTMGLMDGAMKSRVEEAINNESSHIQVHTPEFMENKELVFTIDETNDVINFLEKMPEVEASSDRFKIFTSLRTAHGNTGVAIVSVDPDKESSLTAISKKLIEGEYFNDKKKEQIIISKKTADKLQVRIGSKIAVDFVKLDSVPTASSFKVVGIFKTSNSMFDEMTAFIRNKDMINIVGFPENKSHEIAVRLKNNDDLNLVQQKISDQFPDLDIKTWIELQPEIGMLVEMGGFMLFVIMLIILLALSFGIINTMLMAIMERTKELGMLMAVGMSRGRIFRMIMLETIFLSLTGALIGMFVGGIFIEYLGKYGLDLSQYAEGFEQIGYSSIIYPSLSLAKYFFVLIMVIAIAMFSSLYPARKALKLKPVEALKTDN
ncbi:MAG: FtsX-like permease family protein [Bacteroidota bacterium]